ncbi:hypothetical protein ERC79_12980 [Rhodococcus sp. ABRD24]|uniref:hypothetical protein n=1 Tax=Rhodococcus sp. ABRD24 TaxID=2507582 RepID=UPI00103BFFF9|nr:hypothetical protein [Rhodococcus sp. ABRD24]QBJ96774.1 hypothetical protein ERC79_12980 [Rhodococcus sp. ABRD24]
MDAIGELLTSMAELLARVEQPLDTSALTEDLAERRRAEQGRTVATVRDALARIRGDAPAWQIPAELEATNPAVKAMSRSVR